MLSSTLAQLMGSGSTRTNSKRLWLFIAHGGLQKAEEKALEELKAEEERVKIRNMNVSGAQSEYGGHWGSFNEPGGTVDLFDVLRDIFRLFKR